MDKKKRTVINSAIGIAYKTVCMLFPFVIRTIIIKLLGSEYAGLNSLFTSIISALSLAELGVGNAVVYCMYKPIVDGNTSAICALLKYIRKMYLYIGAIVLLIGLAITPFLEKLINGGYPADVNLYILFLMYIFNLVFGYFFYGYTTALFLAHQRNDIISIVSLIVFVLQYLVQILVLFVSRNYMIYILVFAVSVIPQNFMYKFISGREFPNYKCIGEISYEERKYIKTEISALLGHKIGAVVLVSIDSALISSFIGLSELGKYGNYYYIFSSVIALTAIISQSLLSAIGQKLVSNTTNESYDLFKRLSLAWMFLVTWCSCCLYGLLNPFIMLTFGKDYCYSQFVVAVIVVYYFSWQFRNMGLMFKDAAGLWSKDWYKPYLGMIINFFGSLFLIYTFRNVLSVLVPTIIVMSLIYFPIETKVLHQCLFLRSSFNYLKNTAFFLLYSIISVLCVHLCCSVLNFENAFFSFIIRLPVCIFSPTILFCLFYHRTEEFICLKNDISNMIRKRKI